MMTVCLGNATTANYEDIGNLPTKRSGGKQLQWRRRAHKEEDFSVVRQIKSWLGGERTISYTAMYGPFGSHIYPFA